MDVTELDELDRAVPPEELPALALSRPRVACVNSTPSAPATMSWNHDSPRNANTTQHAAVATRSAENSAQ